MTDKPKTGRPAYATKTTGGIKVPLTTEELLELRAEARKEGRTNPQHLRIKLGLKPL